MQASSPFKVIVITTLEKAIEISNAIESRKPAVLGFDLESSDTKKVDLISLCENNENNFTVFLFHNAFFGTIPKALKSILEGDRILKSGNGLVNDIARLQNSGISFSGGVELSYLSRIKGLPCNLKDLWNTLFPNSYHMRDLPHNIHGEWNKSLTPSLIEYAAYDAYASLMCCLELLNIKVEPNDIITEDNDCSDYRNWITSQLIPGTRRTMESLVNQSVSSYGPWAKKYKQETRVALAKHNLMIGVNEKRYFYDERAEVFMALENDKLENKDKIEAKELVVADYKLINTLKYDSACNFLFTSSKNFNNIPVNIKKEVIRLSIEKAIKDGKIKSEGGKLYTL